MRYGSLVVAVVLGTLAVSGGARVVTMPVASADPARGSVVVPLMGAGGQPVFCTVNHSGGRARPRQPQGEFERVESAPRSRKVGRARHDGRHGGQRDHG